MQEEKEEIDWDKKIDGARIEGKYQPINQYCFDRKLDPAIVVGELNVHLAMRFDGATKSNVRKIRVPTYNSSGVVNGYQDIPFEEEGTIKKSAYKSTPDGFGLQALATSDNPIKNILLLEGASDYLTGKHLFRGDDSWLVVSCLGVGSAKKTMNACMEHSRCQGATLHILLDGDAAGDTAVVDVGIKWRWKIRILRPSSKLDLSDIWRARAEHISPPPVMEEAPQFGGHYSDALNSVAHNFIQEYFSEEISEDIHASGILLSEDVGMEIKIDTRRDADDLKKFIILKRLEQSSSDAQAPLIEGISGSYNTPNEAYVPPDEECNTPDEYYEYGVDENWYTEHEKPQAQILSSPYGNFEQGSVEGAEEERQTSEQKELARKRRIGNELAQIADKPLSCHDLSDYYERFWYPDFDSKEYILPQIKNLAASDIVSPMAVLAAMLVQVSAAISHNWKINSGGAESPLNLFISLVAGSGTGKSKSEYVASKWLRIDEHTNDSTTVQDGCPEDRRFIPHQRTGSPVSGEALLGQLLGEVEIEGEGKPRTVRQQVINRCYYTYDEVRTLVDVSSRPNNPLKGYLRMAWNGHALSTLLSDAANSRDIERGQYTMGILSGSQLDIAAELIADRDEGDSQRWIWIPANADDLRFSEQFEKREIRVSHWDLTPHGPFSQFSHINLDPSIQEDIRQVLQVGVRSVSLPEKLENEYTNIGHFYNQHALLQRLRIAAVIAALCRQDPYITRELFDWAGSFINISHRASMLLEEEAKKKRAEQMKIQRAILGEDAAHIKGRETEVATVESSKLINRVSKVVARRIWKLIGEGEKQVAYSKASEALASSHVTKWKSLGFGEKKSLVETALTKAEEDGHIVQQGKYWTMGHKDPNL